jgi:hypothetical protein
MNTSIITQEKKTAFFTVVATNYLAYATVLGNSIKHFHPEEDFYIFIVDDPTQQYKDILSGKGFRTIYPSHINIVNYDHFVFQYEITEASTGVKPYVLGYLVNELNYDKAVYLDPDILCFNKLERVLSLLDDHSIVITPHSCSPVRDGSFPSDVVHLSSGSYNLGFIAVSKTTTTGLFLKWWQDRLLNLCVNAPEAGLFVDQKWIDLVPSYFDSVFILRDRSYNIAYWNLHERLLRTDDDNCYYVRDGEIERPVTFVHFSGVSIKNPEQLTKYQPNALFGDVDIYGSKDISLNNTGESILSMLGNYLNLLLAAGAEDYSQKQYLYSKYDNGEDITSLERIIFLRTPTLKESFEFPFQTSDKSLWKYFRYKGLKSQDRHDSNSSDSNPKILSRQIFFVRLTMRFLYSTLGSKKFMNLVKFLRKQVVSLNLAKMYSDQK